MSEESVGRKLATYVKKVAPADAIPETRRQISQGTWLNHAASGDLKHTSEPEGGESEKGD
jgi:hypothetical protein